MSLRKFLEDKGVIEPEDEESGLDKERAEDKHTDPRGSMPHRSAPSSSPGGHVTVPAGKGSAGAPASATAQGPPIMFPQVGPAQPDVGTYEKLMAQVNSSAPALYTKFQEKVQQMSFISNVTDRYKTALVAVSATDDALLQAMQARVKKLDGEEQEYAAFIQSETERRVSAKRTRLDAIKAHVAELNSKLESIRTEIANGTNDIEQLDAAIQADLGDIGKAAAVFKASAQQVRSALEQEYQQTVKNIGGV